VLAQEGAEQPLFRYALFVSKQEICKKVNESEPPATISGAWRELRLTNVVFDARNVASDGDRRRPGPGAAGGGGVGGYGSRLRIYMFDFQCAHTRANHVNENNLSK
jgi:hypothetical protein